MFRVEFSTDNAAFADGDRAAEVARILHVLAGDARVALIDDDTIRCSFPLFDINGNKIGEAMYTND